MIARNDQEREWAYAQLDYGHFYSNIQFSCSSVHMFHYNNGIITSRFTPWLKDRMKMANNIIKYEETVARAAEKRSK